MVRQFPSRVSMMQKMYCCYLVIARPNELARLEQEDNSRTNRLLQAGGALPLPEPPVLILGRAYRQALLAVAGSAVLAFGVGVVLRILLPAPPSPLVYVLQFVGAFILLWATLAVRGWDIQSRGGFTLSERVNQWLYRSLYCLGTALVVAVLTWNMSFQKPDTSGSSHVSSGSRATEGREAKTR